ncbi:hypothetical protein [Paenibacillus odorifer]|uniref:hypothetical protein n=1 Tax=Paenibacillus odorifer TaxID=189426 RepID=UPI001115972E|nr:hypothetical protein [Paenibacillus odorifer]
MNHKKVWRIMKELSIKSIIRKNRRQSSYTLSIVFPNRLKRKFHATAPQHHSTTAPQQKNGNGYYLYFGRN